jgi:predicted transcriptional regulator
MAIAATSLKLPATLKSELEKLARRTGETTHAVMVRALAEHVAASKRYQNFLDDAVRADADMQQSGVGYAMQDVHSYVTAKIRGEAVKRPKPVKWRK